MKLSLQFLFVLYLITSGTLRLAEAQSLNTILRANWDDNNLISESGLTYNDLWGYEDGSGREYAIVGSRYYTHFIDVTNPDNVVEVDREEGGNNCLWRDFKVYGHFAYGVTDGCGGGLEIFDLSPLPDSVHKVYDSDTFLTNAHNIFIDESKGRLYACGINNGPTDMVILDLTDDPAQPVLLKNLSLPDGYVHDLYVRNDTAYCSHIYIHKLIIYDFSDLEDIFSLGTLSSSRFNHSNWVSEDGDVIVIADESFDKPVLIANIEDIESPTVVSTFKSTLLAPAHTNSIAHNPFIVGNDFVVLSYYDDGLQIFKIDSSTVPFQAGYYDTDTLGLTYQGNGAWGAYPFLPSGNLLASDIENGLFVITPQFPLSDCNSDVSVKGSYDNFWDFVSSDTFTSTAEFHDQATIKVFAPQSITLQPEFVVGQGSTFSAILDDKCSTTTLQKPKLRKKSLVTD